MQVAAVRLLAQLGDAGQQPLRVLVADRRRSPAVRYHAGVGLAVGERDVVLLLDLLEEGNATLAMLASRALRRFADDRRVAMRARRLVRHRGTVVRRQTLRLLGAGRLPETAALIRRGLDDRAHDVRSAAMLAAGERGLRDVAPRIAGVLTDERAPRRLRVAASRALTDLAPSDEALTTRLLALFAEVEADALLRATLPELLVAMRPDDPRVLAALRVGQEDRSPMVRNACRIELARRAARAAKAAGDEEVGR